MRPERRGRLRVVALPAALLAMLATSAAAPAPGRAPRGAGPFLLLSAADESHAEAGCTCAFIVGHGRDLLQLSGHILLSRTRAGLNLCPLSEAQFQSISGRGGWARCDGRRLAFRSGRARRMGNDSWSAAAIVSVTEEGRTRLLHGTWACAC